MKRKQTLLMLVALATLSACNKNEELQETTTTNNTNIQNTTFNITSGDVKTRATSGVTRYIMEVYSDASAETPENCFDATGSSGTATHRAVKSTDQFVVKLDKTKTYTILFWADDGDETTGANKTYDADDLKAVKLADTKIMSKHAYFLNKTDKVNVSQDIVLNRAVAQIIYVQNGAYPDVTDKDDKTVKITYDKTYSFNCVTGDVDASEGTSRTHTFPKQVFAENTIFGSDYHFAISGSTQETLVNITINVVEEYLAGINVDAIPVRANQTTKLQGQYSASTIQLSTFSITNKDTWGTDDNDHNLLPTK